MWLGRRCTLDSSCFAIWGSVRLMSTIGFRISELRRVEAYLLRHFEQLCNDWNRIHGLP